MKHLKAIDFSEKKILEKYSSAFTLSDMEIFIFPELFYPLVLANIMSPVIWEWRNDPWFSNIEKKGFTYKTNRIKQYIIQNYIFNLDLATWGLTTKEREVERFRDHFDMELLRQSNALFGYEGDKYYFDIDIRKHFGLDKFNTNVIPYWKTETIEAMGAFKYRDGFATGAGECVSLSALYAAAMFIVGRIPLERIFLIATPLHSQNFILEKEGLITNNRRIVTKNMWFNGTSLSEKARRALEKEKVTIVSHISGYIHTIYDRATIDAEAYDGFANHLNDFLRTNLTRSIFINFLRFKSRYKTLFQYRCDCSGVARYIMLDKMYEYEHGSKFSVSEESREMLVREIEGDEFHLSPIQGKILLNDAEKILKELEGKSLAEIEEEFVRMTGRANSYEIREMFREIGEFICIKPRLPDREKRFEPCNTPQITTDDSRSDIIGKIYGYSGISEACMLSLYVYRQMDIIDWHPFVKAALERNPVCYNDLAEGTPGEVFERVKKLPDQSIYDDKRLALPDEVWNFRRGDGIEKAFLMADFLLMKDVNASMSLTIDRNHVTLQTNEARYSFGSSKNLQKKIEITGYSYRISG